MTPTIYPTIYKRTSAGKTQIWFAEVDEDIGRYRTTSGQIDGKKTTTEWTQAKPKNEGRANATNVVQQAITEVEAEYQKKLARDYKMSIDRIDTQSRFKPMLATKWKDRASKVTQETVHMQPKLDGMRCIATKDGLWSREGKPIYGVPHIHAKLQPLFEANSSLIFDGELYNHALKDDFNKIVSIAKKQSPTEEELKVSEQLIQYWVYDMPSAFGAFSQRLNTLKSTIEADDHLVIVSTVEVPHSLVDETAASYIGDGFEGGMIRLDGEYQNKRSNNLIKWKEMQDEEFTILDIQEGDGNRSGMAARVIFDLDGTRTFSAGLIGNEAYCKQLLIEKDQHIGKPGTVVFQNYTPDGVPRFPKCKCVRDYE